MLKLDHAVICVNNLDEAGHDFRSLGFNVIPGGVHANKATQNALIVFKDGTYLELMALTGTAPVSGLPDFSQLFKDGEGLAAYALTTVNLLVEIASMRQRGIKVSDPIDGSRQRPDGITIRWKTAFIDGTMTPFFIQDMTPRNLRVPDSAAITTHPNGAIGITNTAFLTEDHILATGVYKAILGISPDTSESGSHFNILGSTIALYNNASSAFPASVKPHQIAIKTSKETGKLDFARTHNANLILVRE